MKGFDPFLKKLLKNPSPETTFLIKGKRKKIKAMARFTTKNYPRDEYTKIVFNDHSFLLILLKEKELYYSDKYVIDIPEITDEIIGKKEIVEFNGKKYKLGN